MPDRPTLAPAPALAPESPTTPDWENYQAMPADDKLWMAAKDGHRPVQELIDALREGGNPRFPDGAGQSPLHMAARYGDAAKIEVLLTAGADLNAPDDRKDTPLHWAVRHGNEETATALLDAGASAGARNADNRTPADLLREARRFAQPETLDRLSAKLKRAAGAALLATLGADAAADAPSASAKQMTSADATPPATDWDVAESLAASGALWGSVMNAEAPARWTAEALEWGANVAYRDLNGDTALHIAARTGSAEKIAALHKGRADMNAQDAEGRTPLHVAAEIGNTETARALLAAGADPDAKGVCRQTPREIMEARCTPLHRVARDGTAEDVARLLAAGENLEAVDGFGQTPLHRAARHGNEAVAEALLAAGADPRAKNLQQRRPLELLMVDRKALGLSDEVASAIAHRLIFANADLREREGRVLPDAQPAIAAEARGVGAPRVENRPLSR